MGSFVSVQVQLVKNFLLVATSECLNLHHIVEPTEDVVRSASMLDEPDGLVDLPRRMTDVPSVGGVEEPILFERHRWTSFHWIDHGVDK